MRSGASTLFLACSVIWAVLEDVATAQEGIKADCQSVMQKWITRQRELFPADRPADPHKMLYFLHVPRTAGRTTHNCFMMPATPPSRRCAKSYDGLKYDISIPDCGLISSHDDFSAMSELPETAAVFTSIRNPITRFLSAYEFSVELGARDAIRGKPVRMGDNKAGKVNTKEVWPWSYLQPSFADDMIPRVWPRECVLSLHFWAVPVTVHTSAPLCTPPLRPPGTPGSGPNSPHTSPTSQGQPLSSALIYFHPQIESFHCCSSWSIGPTQSWGTGNESPQQMASRTS